MSPCGLSLCEVRAGDRQPSSSESLAGADAVALADMMVVRSPSMAIAQRNRRPQTYTMATADEIAVLRIELQGIEPLIWRRVAVSTRMSLTDVHRVIQVVMGWLDYHLWDFEVNGRK